MGAKEWAARAWDLAQARAQARARTRQPPSTTRCARGRPGAPPRRRSASTLATAAMEAGSGAVPGGDAGATAAADGAAAADVAETADTTAAAATSALCRVLAGAMPITDALACADALASAGVDAARLARGDERTLARAQDSVPKSLRRKLDACVKKLRSQGDAEGGASPTKRGGKQRAAGGAHAASPQKGPTVTVPPPPPPSSGGPDGAPPSPDVSTNRAPVMCAWAAACCVRAGLDWEAALSLASACTALNAQSKGASLGILAPSAADGHGGALAVSGETRTVLGRLVPIVRGDGPLRAMDAQGTIKHPANVARYLERAFAEHWPSVWSAMCELARGLEPDDALGRGAYALYERFRPNVPQGTLGWGQRGVLKVAFLRELARELCRPRQQQPKEQASAEPRPLTARIQEILFEVREGVSLAAITSRTQETEERCLSALEELQLLGAIYVDGQGMYAAL